MKTSCLSLEAVSFSNIYVQKMGCGRLVLLCMQESWNKISIWNWRKAQDSSNSCRCGDLCLLGKDTCCELGQQSSSAWHSRAQYNYQNSILRKREKENQEETWRDRGKVLLPLWNSSKREAKVVNHHCSSCRWTQSCFVWCGSKVYDTTCIRETSLFSKPFTPSSLLCLTCTFAVFLQNFSAACVYLSVLRLY